jgi:hypothetical protein
MSSLLPPNPIKGSEGCNHIAQFNVAQSNNICLFLSKVLQNQDTIQTNQQISYQADKDSLLNILQLIWQYKPL